MPEAALLHPRTKLHILLVEDSATHAQLITDALAEGEYGLILDVARTLAEAVTKLAHYVPDLVIADLLLPDGKGVDLLPGEGIEASFPVIILTGRGNEKEAVEAMKAGAVDYLVKSPDTLTSMPHIVDRVLRSWQHIVERRRAEQMLRESEEKFRSVFITAAAGLVIVSPTGEILQANPAFCRFTGYREDELKMLTIEEVTHPEDRDRTSLHYGEIFAGERKSLHYEKRYLRKDGQVVWGHASVACVMHTDLQPEYCIALVQDISERVRMEEELREANRELDSFVHTVSHDLRSPLTPIICYSEFLQEHYHDRLDDQALGILGEIERQGHRMLALLEDLLALARVGFLERPAETVDGSSVVTEVIAGLGGQLIEAGVTVTTGEMPGIRVPKTFLAQLFDNLIGNALRYAAAEGSVIEVGGSRHGVLVRYFVRDHGPGIPLHERESVFDLFYRGSTGEKLSGTGVGLATVQKIARVYGGKAWVEETPGGGSTFWVEMVDAAPEEGARG